MTTSSYFSISPSLKMNCFLLLRCIRHWFTTIFFSQALVLPSPLYSNLSRFLKKLQKASCNTSLASSLSLIYLRQSIIIICAYCSYTCFWACRSPFRQRVTKYASSVICVLVLNQDRLFFFKIDTLLFFS